MNCGDDTSDLSDLSADDLSEVWNSTDFAPIDAIIMYTVVSPLQLVASRHSDCGLA